MTNHSKKILSVLPNPHKNKIFTVSIIQEITLNHKVFLFGLRYIPDKLLLDHEGLVAYLGNILAGDNRKAETLAHDIIEDVMNQIIPRWVEITLKQKSNKFGQTVLITMEDRQPDWEYPPLLARLAPLL